MYWSEHAFMLTQYLMFVLNNLCLAFIYKPKRFYYLNMLQNNELSQCQVNKLIADCESLRITKNEVIFYSLCVFFSTLKNSNFCHKIHNNKIVFL